jgi:hypothetical protein
MAKRKRYDSRISYLAENVPANLAAFGTIPVSSVECEQGFPQMNLIVSPTRTSRTTKIVQHYYLLKLSVRPSHASTLQNM